MSCRLKALPCQFKSQPLPWCTAGVEQGASLHDAVPRMDCFLKTTEACFAAWKHLLPSV